MKKNLTILVLSLIVFYSCSKNENETFDSRLEYDCLDSVIFSDFKNLKTSKYVIYYKKGLISGIKDSNNLTIYKFNENNKIVERNQNQNLIDYFKYNNLGKLIYESHEESDKQNSFKKYYNYVDTLLKQELTLNSSGDTTKVITYFYNQKSQIDSIYINGVKSYDYYYTNNKLDSIINYLYDQNYRSHICSREIFEYNLENIKSRDFYTYSYNNSNSYSHYYTTYEYDGNIKVKEKEIFNSYTNSNNDSSYEIEYFYINSKIDKIEYSYTFNNKTTRSVSKYLYSNEHLDKILYYTEGGFNSEQEYKQTCK